MILKGIKWFVYSNLWISFNVVAFYLYCSDVLNLKVVPVYAVLIFLGTLFAYNFQRLLKDKGDFEKAVKSERHQWIHSHQNLITFLSVFSGLISFSLGIYILPLNLLLLSAPFIVVVLFYARSDRRLKSLRNLPVAKIFLISIVWVFAVIGLPVLGARWPLMMVDWVVLILAFAYVFVLCIPFDIRDVRVDKETVKTIPSLMGVEKTKVYTVILIIGMITLANYFEMYSMCISLGVIACSVGLSNEKRRELFFTGWLDGQFLLLFMLHQIWW